MQERRLAVYRTARYYTAAPRGATEVWLVCHGYGQLARRFLRHFEPLAAAPASQAGGRLIVAPEALSRFYVDAGGHRHVGASWMTRDAREDEIDDYVRWLDTAYADALERAGIPKPVRLVVLGFSQGCATASRWLAGSAMLPPHRCDRLILWGGALPPDLEAHTHAEWLSGRLTLVAGEADEHVSPAQLSAERARLEAHGVKHELVHHPGGHRLDRDVLVALAEA